MWASVVLPRPGGPSRRTWSSGSRRAAAALRGTPQLLAHVTLSDRRAAFGAGCARSPCVAAILRLGESLVSDRAAPQHGERPGRRSPASPLVFEGPSSASAAPNPRATSASRAARYSPSPLPSPATTAGPRGPDALAQLEREPLFELAAHARDARQLRDVAINDRPSHHRGPVHPRIASAILGPRAVDPAQEVEQVALVRTSAKPVQRERVLAHDQLGLQRYELGRLPGAPGRGGRGVEAQADASDLDQSPSTSSTASRPRRLAIIVQSAARLVRRPRMAQRDGERIGGVLRRMLALEAEDRDDHPADLLLRRAPEAAHRALHCAGAYSAEATPAAPQAASATPRAWPTARIARGSRPMNSDSSAAASGAWRASTATMPSWIRWRRSPGRREAVWGCRRGRALSRADPRHGPRRTP